MGALAIVEDFDVIEDGGLSLAASGKFSAIDHFQFEGAPEAFDVSIVVAVAFAAHGGDQARLGEGGAIISRSVLHATIGVKQQIFGRLAVQESHAQSL